MRTIKNNLILLKEENFPTGKLQLYTFSKIENEHQDEDVALRDSEAMLVTLQQAQKRTRPSTSNGLIPRANLNT